jgi:hypothetical protein
MFTLFYARHTVEMVEVYRDILVIFLLCRSCVQVVPVKFLMCMAQHLLKKYMCALL